MLHRRLAGALLRQRLVGHLVVSLLALGMFGCSEDALPAEDADVADVGSATGSPCSGTPESGAECVGGLCLELLPNAQDRAGICSQDCETIDDCTHGGGCASLYDGRYCFVPCASDSDCGRGFVCLAQICRVVFEGSHGATPHRRP